MFQTLALVLGTQPWAKQSHCLCGGYLLITGVGGKG